MDNNPYLISTVSKLPAQNFYEFAAYVKPVVFEIENQFQIPLIVPTIQAAHESRNGNSGLARKYGNLFGIVATETWKSKGGLIVAMPTWEEIKGKRVDMTREFRAYGSWIDSFYDWANLITKLSVYKKAYQDFKDGNIVEGIKKMGVSYASDSRYGKKLLQIYNEVKDNL